MAITVACQATNGGSIPLILSKWVYRITAIILDFQSKDVGSIPTTPSKNKINICKKGLTQTRIYAILYVESKK